jgi:outer membrane protein assembly factor BamA
VAFDLDRQTGGATLVLTVDAGLPLRFGAVRFLGSLRMTDEDGQALVPFRAGDPYSVTAIEGLHRALYERDMFRRIRVETVADPDRPGTVDLNVRLRDKAGLPPVASQPWLLLSTILYLAVMQTLRMTAAWSNTGLRRLMIGTAILLLAGSAVEVAQRLYGFLNQ